MSLQLFLIDVLYFFFKHKVLSHPQVGFASLLIHSLSYTQTVNSHMCICLSEMMRILLEYQECPQYLRKHLFQFSAHLRCVGVLNALNSPHHLRHNQWSEYR